MDISESGIAPARWPKAIGVLSVIFGVLGILLPIAMLATIPIFSGVVRSQLDGAQMPPSMELSPLVIGLTAFGTLVNIGLIVAGFMLIARRSFGRTLHLAYAIVGVLAVFGGVFYNFQTQAKMAEWASRYPDNAFVQNMGDQGTGMFAVIGLLIGLAVGLTWPVFCIVWFGIVKRVVPPAFEE